MDHDKLPEKNLEEDPELERKRQLMLDRLSARHQSRVDNSLARRSDGSSSDTTAAFLSRFTDSKRFIESQFSDAKRITDSDPSAVKSHLASVSSSIADLEKLVAENSYLLPSYEVRSSLKSVSDLKQNLEILTAELLPKKKFSFKNRATVKTESLKQVEKSEAAPKRNGFNVRDSPGFRNKRNETLTKRFIGTDIGEFTLSDLDSCEVRLCGCFNALFVNRLRNCKVYSGPVMGSVLIEDVEECVFVLASHQIRIHLAKKSDFYLRVRSRPIIEDSNGVRFAPILWSMMGLRRSWRELV